MSDFFIEYGSSPGSPAKSTKKKRRNLITSRINLLIPLSINNLIPEVAAAADVTFGRKTWKFKFIPEENLIKCSGWYPGQERVNFTVKFHPGRERKLRGRIQSDINPSEGGWVALINFDMRLSLPVDACYHKRWEKKHRKNLFPHDLNDIIFLDRILVHLKPPTFWDPIIY